MCRKRCTDAQKGKTKITKEPNVKCRVLKKSKKKTSSRMKKNGKSYDEKL